MNEIWVGWFTGIAFGLAISCMLDRVFARRESRLNAAAPFLLQTLKSIKRRMYEPRSLMIQEVEAMIDKAISTAGGDA